MRFRSKHVAAAVVAALVAAVLTITMGIGATGMELANTKTGGDVRLIKCSGSIGNQPNTRLWPTAINARCKPSTTTTTSAPTTTTTTAKGGAAPTVDASSPSFAQAGVDVPSITTPSFSPPAASVLYAVFSMDSCPIDTSTDCAQSGPNMDISSVTNSGTPLTWNLLALENHAAATVGGFVEVFWAANPSGQNNITVAGTFNVNTKNVAAPTGGLQVLVMDHAAADQTSSASVVNWNVASTSAPTATLTTTAANSQVFGAFDNWDSAATPTLGNGQTLYSAIYNATDRDAYWVQEQSSPTANSGTAVTEGDTAPSNIHWHEIAWEVKAA